MQTRTKYNCCINTKLLSRKTLNSTWIRVHKTLQMLPCTCLNKYQISVTLMLKWSLNKITYCYT